MFKGTDCCIEEMETVTKLLEAIRQELICYEEASNLKQRKESLRQVLQFVCQLLAQESESRDPPQQYDLKASCC